MQAEDVLLGTLSAALIVLSGALYALLFAFGKLRASRRLIELAFGAYTVLVASVFVLGRALGLERLWIVVVIVMLLGYLFAPMAIWRLCVGTHGVDPAVPVKPAE